VPTCPAPTRREYAISSFAPQSVSGLGGDQRIYVRNILTNAAASNIVSFDVVKLFLEWIRDYSEYHFAVVTAIYNSAGITRGDVLRKLGKATVRENSSDADLFRLLFRDLSTGGLIRQHRETTYEVTSSLRGLR
jgi:hypothetical protein